MFKVPRSSFQSKYQLTKKIVATILKLRISTVKINSLVFPDIISNVDRIVFSKHGKKCVY